LQLIKSTKIAISAAESTNCILLHAYVQYSREDVVPNLLCEHK